MILILRYKLDYSIYSKWVLLPFVLYQLRERSDVLLRTPLSRKSFVVSFLIQIDINVLLPLLIPSNQQLRIFAFLVNQEIIIVWGLKLVCFVIV